MAVLAKFFLTVESLEQIVALAKAVGKDENARASCEKGNIDIRIFGGGRHKDIAPAIEFTVLREPRYIRSQCE